MGNKSDSSKGEDPLCESDDLARGGEERPRKRQRIAPELRRLRKADVNLECQTLVVEIEEAEEKAKTGKAEAKVAQEHILRGDMANGLADDWIPLERHSDQTQVDRLVTYDLSELPKEHQTNPLILAALDGVQQIVAHPKALRHYIPMDHYDSSSPNVNLQKELSLVRDHLEELIIVLRMEDLGPNWGSLAYSQPLEQKNGNIIHRTFLNVFAFGRKVERLPFQRAVACSLSSNSIARVGSHQRLSLCLCKTKN